LVFVRVFPKERLIDPGVVPEARTTERYARLLAAGCAALGPGGAGDRFVGRRRRDDRGLPQLRL